MLHSLGASNSAASISSTRRRSNITRTPAQRAITLEERNQIDSVNAGRSGLRAVGKVVVAQPEFAPGSDKLPAIAHRIISSQPGGWLTQGDANPEPDGWVVRPQDISRVSILVIPTAKIRSPYTVAILIGLMVLYFLWPGKVTETMISTVPVDARNQRLKHARTGRHRKLRP